MSSVLTWSLHSLFYKKSREWWHYLTDNGCIWYVEVV